MNGCMDEISAVLHSVSLLVSDNLDAKQVYNIKHTVMDFGLHED